MFARRQLFGTSGQMPRRFGLIVWSLCLVVLAAVLLTSAASAQTGSAQLTVNACQDQNADGVCTGSEAPLPGAEACLNDGSTCQPVPATFSALLP